MAMKSLYNSKVKSARWVHRPLQMMGKSLEAIKDIVEHQGIVVKIESGKEYLIHIAPSSKAVITDAVHMTKKWSSCKTIDNCSITVETLMARAEKGGVYAPFTNNCYTVAQIVWELIQCSQIA